MSYYTKGPWEIQGSSTINIISKANLKGRKVASIQVFQSEDRHNAILIAAAPDMLEALELLINDNRLMNAMNKEQSKAIMYAINKAKGE